MTVQELNESLNSWKDPDKEVYISGADAEITRVWLNDFGHLEIVLDPDLKETIEDYEAELANAESAVENAEDERYEYEEEVEEWREKYTKLKQDFSKFAYFCKDLFAEAEKLDITKDVTGDKKALEVLLEKIKETQDILSLHYINIDKLSEEKTDI